MSAGWVPSPQHRFPEMPRAGERSIKPQAALPAISPRVQAGRSARISSGSRGRAGQPRAGLERRWASPGDNLYTGSLLALRAEDGALQWHFQFTPHDDHDWDATEIPVLFEDRRNGRARKLVAMANRNAFYYVLDRTTGEFLVGAPYAKQTWANGLDEKGRPKLLPNISPTAEGTLVYPSLQGADELVFSPSFDPVHSNVLFAAVREMGSPYSLQDRSRIPAWNDVHGRGRAGVGRRCGVRRSARPRCPHGRNQMEFPVAVASVGGRYGHCRRRLVFGGSNEAQFLRAGCSFRHAVVGLPDRRHD